MLDEQVRKIEESGGTVEEAHLEMGIPPGRAIVHLGEELGAGVVVVGSRGRDPMRRAVMGSVSSSVVHHAHCPVLVARGKGVTICRAGSCLPSTVPRIHWRLPGPWILPTAWNRIFTWSTSEK